jgi:nitrilase
MSDVRKKTLKVALFQMASGDAYQVNFQKVESQLEKLAQADLVVLPEMWSFMVPDSRGGERLAFSKTYRTEVFSQLQSWAKKLQNVWIGGTIFEPEVETGKVKNTCYVFDAKGEEVSRYQKMHLFDNALSENKFCESESVAAGTYSAPISLGRLKLGLGICYDLRFPYHFQALSAHGAQIIALPSAFTYKTGEAHWEVLLRARAIENQCYILACNQTTGGMSGVNCWGHSMVIDPWGKVVAQSEHEEMVLQTEIDLDFCDQVRTSMPVLSHRLFHPENSPYDLKR